MFTCLSLAFMVATTVALPDGPPLEACEHMLPGTRVGEIGLEGHTSSPQNIFPIYGNSKIPPYYLLISPDATRYNPSQEYLVYMVANQTQGYNFYKGLILQARRVICASNTTVEVEEEPYGTFTVSGDTSVTLLQTMDCTHERSTIGHRSPQYKINETATWQAPSEYVGHLVFWGTVVQTANIYWTEFYSHVMLDPSMSPSPLCAACVNYISYMLLICCVLVSILKGT